MLSAVNKFISPTFFPTPAHFRRWLERHHQTQAELWVGYYKKSTGQPSITWPDSVDQALCFGWIDGIRKTVDDVRYMVRFTPRRQRSAWSAVNIRNAQRLIDTGRMQPAGMRAFDARQEERCEIYSYEQRPQELPEPFAKQMRRNKRASEFFEAQPRGYRRRLIWWIVSARTGSTQQKRLTALIETSAKKRRYPLRAGAQKKKRRVL